MTRRNGPFSDRLLDRIKGYNQVNVLSGYGMITVVSPKEVNFDE